MLESASQVTRVILGAAEFAADFAPLPYLSIVVGLALGVVELCENVHVNKRGVNGVGRRCQQLLYSIRETESSRSPAKTRELVDTCEQLLIHIQNRMKKWRDLNKLMQFLQQAEITESVRDCNESIDAFMEAFAITSSLDTHNWMINFEERCNSNQDEVLTCLASIKDDVSSLKECVNLGMIPELMRLLQELLGQRKPGDQAHSNLASILYTVQTYSGELLPVYNLNQGEVKKLGTPVGGGANFDIWKGRYLDSQDCAIKALREFRITPQNRSRFLREIKIWRDIWEVDRGRYILPFYGACCSNGVHPPWMQYGDVLHYVNKYPYVPRGPIILRIAEGINFLHSQKPPISHGDIKPANILINDDGNPLLSDFGLSKIIEDLTGVPFTQSCGMSGSFRYFAPELYCEPYTLSCASDIYAFSMTVLSIMTGKQPFSYIRRDPEVLIGVSQDQRPQRPMEAEVIQLGLDDRLWNLLVRCWDRDPQKRPSAQELVNELSSYQS